MLHELLKHQFGGTLCYFSHSNCYSWSVWICALV